MWMKDRYIKGFEDFMTEKGLRGDISISDTYNHTIGPTLPYFYVARRITFIALESADAIKDACIEGAKQGLFEGPWI